MRMGRRQRSRVHTSVGHLVESLEDRRLLAAAGLITTPQTYAGALSGKIVFTSGGHGWQYNTTLGRYATDRGDNNEVVEDFGNQEQMSAYADYILRAGGTVVPMRPVGRQTNEVVLDNDLAAVTYTGAWSNSTSTKYYDEDYGASADAVPYRYATATTGAESATATYTPNIPAAGFYPVYTWVLYGTDRVPQTYHINHTSGTTDVTVDHSKVGSGWVYLGTYHFNAGNSSTGEGSVVISNKSTGGAAGKVVIADAIRFGNGMGDYIWTSSGATTISGYPREDENSYHWLARSLGVGTTLSSVIGTSSGANVSAPTSMASYMFHGVFGEAVYVGFHSNAGGGRGARGLIDADVPEQTPHQAGTNGLADILGKQINQDFQAQNGVFEFNWTTGTTSTFTGEFGEINQGPSNDMDATIIEVAFHDDVSDAAIMRDPAGRDQIARSTLQGTVQYFSLYGSPVVANTNAPSAPVTPRALSNTSGAVTLNWAAGLSSPASVHGNVATGYKVFTSTDGYGFDGGRVVAGVGTTTLTITGLDPTLPYYFKVVATNAGGESPGSEVVVALPSGGAKDVLIVNGFDRNDRFGDLRYAYLGGLVDRVFPRYNNSFDYVVQTATAIQAAKPGTHVASTSNDAVISGAVNLADYDDVIWILGEESTADDTFNATEQTKVEAFIAAGGNLFLSGSEIAYDLDSQVGGVSFFENTLKGNFVADDAGTYAAVAVAGSIFAGMSSAAFSSGAAYSQLDSQLYNVDAPDVISPQAGATSALTYSGGTGGTAAIQVPAASGRGSIVMLAFPFETITSAARRTDIMGRVLTYFDSFNIPPLGIPTLISDSGVAGDNITRFDNSAAGKELTFTVSGTSAGTTVELFEGATLLGSAPGTAGTTTITTNGTVDLTDGTHQISARQIQSGQPDALSTSPRSITIDTAVPTADVVNITPDPRTTPVTSVMINFSRAVTGFDYTDLKLTFNGATIPLTADQQPSTTNGISYVVNNLASLTGTPGLYTLTVVATGSGIADTLVGNSLVNSAIDIWSVTDGTAPTVSAVFVSGTAWSGGFLSHLASTNAGDATYGFRIPASAQTDELPWTNINKVSIRFSENVSVSADDLVVRGVNTPTYSPAASGAFQYDSATFTATWTLSTAGIPADKLLLDLDADAGTGVVDIAGNRLDGEWTNPVAPAVSGPSSFPSGNGTAGGDFQFRLNVLPGDANRSGGAVVASDMTFVSSAQATLPGSALYTIFKDVNGSATINATDVTLVRDRQGTAMPASEPVVPPAITTVTLNNPTGKKTDVLDVMRAGDLETVTKKLDAKALKKAIP